MTNPQKGIWSLYNSRHDQSTMGIDPISNISNKNKNTRCSYIISTGFWTARLMKVFGHEGQCTCRYNTHGWIVYIMLFLVVCGTSYGSSWLSRNDFLKMKK
jgi:hypothetical protein